MYTVQFNGKAYYVGTPTLRVSHYMNKFTAQAFCELVNVGTLEPQFHIQEVANATVNG